MTRRPARHTSRPAPAETPVVLPHAVITVTETGTLNVTLDGIDVPSPDEAAWTRGTFGPLLDLLTHDRTVTVRIEVHESDGTMFTDVIHARRRTTPAPPDPLAESETATNIEAEECTPSRSGRKRRPDLVEVTGEGFVPGEDVAVAVIVTHTDAAGTGRARTLLDRSRLRSLLGEGGGEVIMFGRISGTIHVRRLS